MISFYSYFVKHNIKILKYLYHFVNIFSLIYLSDFFLNTFIISFIRFISHHLNLFYNLYICIYK